MATPSIMSTMGVGRGIVFPNDSVWRLQPPATNPRGMVELWNGNSGSTTPPTIMRTGVYAIEADGSIWEYTPPNVTQIFSLPTVATFNPSDVVGGTLSNNNLTMTSSLGTGGTRTISGYTTGKYYWECSCPVWTGNNTSTGIAPLTTNLQTAASTSSGAVMGIFKNGEIYNNGTNTGVELGPRSPGDITGVAVDFSAKLIWFRISPSGNWNGNSSNNPATGAGGFNFSALTGPYYAIGMVQQNLDQLVANFGASTFSGAVPSGFLPYLPR